MVLYILIFGFFFSSLYIGVVVSTFDQERIKFGEYHLLTDTQKKWVAMKKTITNSNPLITKLDSRSRLAQLCFKIRSLFLFKVIMIAAIIFYTYLIFSINPN